MQKEVFDLLWLVSFQMLPLQNSRNCSPRNSSNAASSLTSWTRSQTWRARRSRGPRSTNLWTMSLPTEGCWWRLPTRRSPTWWARSLFWRSVAGLKPSVGHLWCCVFVGMLQLPPTASHAVLMTHGQHLEHNSHYYSTVGAAVIHSRSSPVEKEHSCPQASRGF